MFKTLDVYILKQTSFAFLGGTVVLTAVVWVTQILREVDLVTNKGQTIWLFLEIAGYLIPMLVMIISPIALFVGMVQILNKFSGDSELIVMTASGISPARIMRPFLYLTSLVALMTAILSIWIAPAAIRNLRVVGDKAQSNIISVVVKPGRFIQLQDGLTFHIRERMAGGILGGLIISDSRDKMAQLTYIAERGMITELPSGSFLILENGTLQRRIPQKEEINIVAFEKYAFDLSSFTSSSQVIFRPSERTISELLNPDKNDRVYIQGAGRFRQELHDRFASPLYPFAFMMIALAFLGQAGTTRSSRTGAIISAVLSMLAVKGGGLGISSVGSTNAAITPLVYLFPLSMILFFGGAALGLYRIITMDSFIIFIAALLRKTPLKGLFAR
jgi:lipopolysaccharide export system permease protein